MADTTNAGDDYRITVTKSEKYRVARDGNPDNILGRTAGCRRLMYNRMLNATKAGINKKGKYTWHTPNYPTFLDKENEGEAYLLDVPKQVYAQAFVDLQRAHQNHANNPGHYGTPKYASKNRKESFRLCNTNIREKQPEGDIRWLDSSHLRIPKIGAVHVIRHRNPPAGAIIKNVTFSMSTSGKWFVSVCYSYEISGITPAPITKNLKGIGLDYSSPHLLIDNKGRTADQLIIDLATAAHDGNLNGTPRYKHWYRENEDLIARRARELARKRNSLASKDGVPIQSKNYWRAKATLARRQEEVTNRRRDFLEKLSTLIADSYDYVCIEHLSMKQIAHRSKGRGGYKLGKSTCDNGWCSFVGMLRRKLMERGKYLVRVSKFFPSTQLCHECGHRFRGADKLTLSDRVYVCPECGCTVDRDANAACNILAEGTRILFSQASRGLALPGLVWDERELEREQAKSGSVTLDFVSFIGESVVSRPSWLSGRSSSSSGDGASVEPVS